MGQGILSVFLRFFLNALVLLEWAVLPEPQEVVLPATKTANTNARTTLLN